MFAYANDTILFFRYIFGVIVAYHDFYFLLLQFHFFCVNVFDCLTHYPTGDLDADENSMIDAAIKSECYHVEYSPSHKKMNIIMSSATND